MARYLTLWLRRARKRLIEQFGGECAFCGGRETLQFAHRIETELNGKGRGSLHRYYDVLNNPECYILLCVDCHREFDRLVSDWHYK